MISRLWVKVEKSIVVEETMKEEKDKIRINSAVSIKALIPYRI